MRLRTLALILTLALGVLLAPLAAEGQQPGKVRRIAYLSAPSREAAERWVQVFQQALRELGWVEGQNIVIEFRWAEGKYDRLPDLAAELVRLKVEVIVVPATVAALAAKNATKTIPIVTVLVQDPVGFGLVASLARPGGNITGLTVTPGPEMFGKQLQLLKEAVPKVSRVAVLGNPANPNYPLMLSETQVAARALGLELQLLEARNPKDFNSAFAAIARERAGALLVLDDSMFFAHRRQIADLAAKSRLPAISMYRELAEAGGLMAYSANWTDLFRRAAVYVDKILKGTKPRDLPVEQPTRFELVINMKTVKALGFTIPPSVLIRADEVIK